MKENRLSKRTLLFFVLMTLLAGCTKPPPVFGVLPDFSLTDQEGHPTRKSDLSGKVWVADFIYTGCASFCPMLTQRMSELQGEVRLVSFSVDPENDTPARLKDYAARFQAKPSWLFLTGDSEAVRKTVIEGFKLAMAKEAGSADIFHSNKFVLVDQVGRVRGYFEADPAGLKDLRTALRVLEKEK